MKKKLLLIGILALFCVNPFYGQTADYLKSATATGNGITTNNSQAWTDLFSVSIDLGSNNSDVKYVLVTASINMRTDGTSTQAREANYNIYRSDLVSDSSGSIRRQMKAINETGVESWGIGTLVHIFDVSELSGIKTYTLEHRNKGGMSDQRNVYSSARLTAVALSTAINHYELSNDVKRIGINASTTTSANYEAVTGLTTDAITIPVKGDVFVTASINGKADGTAVAEYILQYSIDGGSSWSDMGESIKRSMINTWDDGIVSLVGLLQDQDADNDFKFRVAHKRVSGSATVTTHNCNLCAVSLVHSNGGYFPSFYSEVDATGVDIVGLSTAAFTVTSSNFTTADDIGTTGTNLFVNSQYLVSASNLNEVGVPPQRMRAGNQVSVTGASSLSTDEYYRYIPDNSIFGAGGFIGLIEDLSGSSSYTVKMEHEIAALPGTASGDDDETLTTSEVILTGFQTYDTYKAQATLAANSSNITALSSTTNNTWTDVGSVDVTLISGNSVLLIGTMESDVTSGNSDLTCKYRLNDGTTQSPIISRYVAAKSYDDYGMSALGYIYEYEGASGSKTFTLQHAKDEPGNSKQFTSKAVLVAMVIDDANISLPNDIKTTGDVTTTSTSYVQVTGTKTDKITLTKPGGIYLTTAFSTFMTTDIAPTVEYVLRYNTDGGDTWIEIPNATISRTNSINLGAATITVLLEHQDAGDYYFDVAHKTSAGTLTTRNLSLCAVGLVDDYGLVLPTFKLTGQSATTSSTSFGDVGSEVVTSVNGSNSLFMHTTFNMSSASIVNPAAFQIAVSGTPATFTSYDLQRYVPAGGTGSGGVVGLTTGLSAYTDYTVKLQHKSSGTSLTTSNANIVGFQLKSAPTIEWDAGASTTDWNTANNWDPNQVPIADVHVSIPDLATDPEIASNQTGSCYNIFVENGATLTIKSSSTTNTGSLIVNGTATGNVTVERFLTHDRWHYISGPANISGNFSTLSMGLTGGVNKDQFYRWEENVNTWVDILNGNGSGTLMGDEGFVSCKGYGINYITTDKTLSLSGVPYIANQSIALAKTDATLNEGSNLVGNPFTSTIALNSNAATTDNFITQNGDALDDNFEAVYLWNETDTWTYPSNADYVVINNSSGATYAAPGQAFMVQAASDNATLNFNTSIRKHGSATFYKNSNANERKSLTLLVNNSDNLSNSTDVIFMSGMTIGLDPSYDAGKMKGNPNIALYTKLVEDNGVDIAIQALPNEGIDNFIIPVGIDVLDAGEFTFSVTQEELDNYNIVLEDRQNNVFTNLRLNSYSAEIIESGAGRFYLHLKDATGVEENCISNLQVWSSKDVINIINIDKQVGDISIVNMLGQTIYKSKLTRDANQQISLNVPTGYYLVTIVTSDGVVNKKVHL